MRTNLSSGRQNGGTRGLPLRSIGRPWLYIVVAGCLAGGAAYWYNRSMEPIADGQIDQSKTSESEIDSGSLLASNRQLDLHPSLKDRRYDSTIRDIVVREDPGVDGWDSEQFTELADKQLKKIGNLLSNATAIDSEHAEQLCTETYRGQLRPGQMTVAFDGPHFRVQRHLKKLATPRVTGFEAMVAALKEQAGAFATATTSHYKFKIIRVQLNGADAITTAKFQMSGFKGSDENSGVQVNSTWDCSWQVSTDSIPKLSEIIVSDYEEVTAKKARLFEDCTESLFAGVNALTEQFVYGRDHWYGNLEGAIGVEGRGNGIAIGDANGDGLDDIYICQPAALPNKLFVRQIDGSLKDVTETSQLDWLDSSRAALFIDVDNDGDQDLVVTQSTQLLVHENDGTGHFQLRSTIHSVSRLFSLNAIDFDQDGDLDLFVCGYSGAAQIRPDDIFASPVPYHDANNGAPNSLFRNDGNWAFSDVTRSVGLDANNLRFSLASTWDDYDNDGDLDLYVANDFGRNNLYRNDDGHFVDVAGESGVEDIGPGMSAAWGDYNNDGLADLYVSNMFSSAGSRITHNSQFKPGAGTVDLDGFRRHARGNTLFENNGDGTFSDRAIESGTTMGRWAWGSLFVDINNDGWQDTYVTNGFVTADDGNDL